MLNENGIRELAYVVKIDDIRPIDGADRVELAVVGGWTVMVTKNQFKPGDLAVYFEIDSKVPEKDPFMFLEAKKFRIVTQKYFKGTVLSQGLLMSFKDFGWDESSHKLGDFVTEELGVTYASAEDRSRKKSSPIDKYKKMAKHHPKIFRLWPVRWLYKYKWGKKFLYMFFGNKKYTYAAWPDWVSKTDEERVQNIPWVLNDKSRWVATEKIDGTSTTATMRRRRFGKPEYYVCSRNVVMTDPDTKTWYDSNVYLEMANKYNFKEVLRELLDEYNLEWVTLQGETYGSGIQKRSYGIDYHDFAGFNLIFSDRGRLPSTEAADIMEQFGIPWVPILNTEFVMPDTVDELLNIASGISKIDNGMREGIVFRTLDGLKSFKAVSNDYLIKYHA